MQIENLPSLSTFLDEQTRSRLKQPTLEFLYQEYAANGILENLVEILQKIPKDYLDPILLTLTTHVTKEKPLLVYSMGKSFGVNEDKTRTVAAVVDLLWALSLMIDDIQDTDTRRAGRTTAWVEYGEEYTYQTAKLGLKAILDVLEDRFGKATAQLCHAYVCGSLNSVMQHRHLTLDSPLGVIVGNYL